MGFRFRKPFRTTLRRSVSLAPGVSYGFSLGGGGKPTSSKMPLLGRVILIVGLLGFLFLSGWAVVALYRLGHS